MASLANDIDRLLSAGESLTAVEISLRMNTEFSGGSNPYEIFEVVACVVACADEMPNVYKAGKEYCREQG